MNVLLIEPEKAPQTVEIDGSLKVMQEIVGGMIEASVSPNGTIKRASPSDGTLGNIS